MSVVWQADISSSKRSEVRMAQDYSARLDLLDFPPWQADDPGDGTDALGRASAKVWPLVLNIARRQLADTVAVEERKTLTLRLGRIRFYQSRKR